MSQVSILIVDDEVDNFDVVETVLSGHNYQLNYADSGQEAISSLNSFQPDLILLDVMMPDMDGITVCQQIKAMPQWKPVPIIMVTALTKKEDLARCLEAGADDFISKPINGLELGARVQSMLRIKQQYDDLQTLLKLREDMVNMAVHDLRDPLVHTLFGLEQLETETYSQDEQERKLVNIYASAQKLQILVDDLLKIALIESGTIHLSRTKINPRDLIQTAIADMTAIAAQNRLSLIYEVPEGSQDKLVFIDVTMIQRALENLLSNAIKSSPAGSQVILKLEQRQPNEFKIKIIDSGTNIPEDVKKKMLETYEVGTLMPDISQIGLELAFCKMVVEAHRGKISVEGREPQGATIEITLPEAA